MSSLGFLPAATKQEQACSSFRSQLWRMQPVRAFEGDSVDIPADVAIEAFLRKFPDCGATWTELVQAWPCPAEEIKLVADRWDQHIKSAFRERDFCAPGTRSICTKLA